MSTPANSRSRELMRSSGGGGAQLADVLERVLDKGIVIAGDIQVNLLDIELLTIRLRLLVASADKAREMGIDWWEGDPFLGRGQKHGEVEDRLKRLERAAGIDGGSGSDDRGGRALRLRRHSRRHDHRPVHRCRLNRRWARPSRRSGRRGGHREL